jgi:hypothetical protein
MFLRTHVLTLSLDVKVVSLDRLAENNILWHVFTLAKGVHIPLRQGNKRKVLGRASKTGHHPVPAPQKWNISIKTWEWMAGFQLIVHQESG